MTSAEIVSVGTPALYAGFCVLAAVVLAVDFVMLRVQGAHKVSFKEAAWWSVIWVITAAAFGVWFWWHLNQDFGADVANQKTLEYAT